jgi:uncharacterized OsmC-like protein
VRSNARSADVAKVAKLTHQRCPIYATLRKALDLTFKITVNGIEISL